MPQVVAPKNMFQKPWRLTQELQDKLCHYIREGNTYANACRIAKLNIRTFKGWMQAGEDENHPCHEFYLAIQTADAECEATAVQQWRKINVDTDDWRSLQNFLERRHKGDWLPPETKSKSTVEITVERNEIAKPDLTKLTDSEFEEYGRLLEKMRKEVVIDIMPQLEAPVDA
jgi:hypothetical protein